MFAAIRAALGAASSECFRIVHFSVQADHVHLLVEADRPSAFSRGMQGLAIRSAKAINRLLRRRGRIWGDRFHSRVLATPREVRNALVYVLNNWRKHEREVRGVDPLSSGPWFSGWQVALEPTGAAPVASAHTWLAKVGWMRHGRIALHESPQGAPA